MIPIILSGGSGTRLWPLSRKSFPKQYLSINEDSKFSLLQNTFLRLKNLNNIQSPIVICNEEHRFLVAEQFRSINVVPKAIILEPCGKNTAPAIAIAALHVIENEEDKSLLILSADHEVKNNDLFIKAINKAKFYSEKGRIVTFGILPTSPETGFGYIEAEGELDNNNIEGEKVSKFIEKPSEEIAKKLILDKKYVWNSGIFLSKASVIINELNKFAPNLLQNCKNSMKEISKDLDFYRLNKESFENCQSISIDKAVMEHTDLATVVPLDAGWSDVGSWKAVWENGLKDINNNIIQGNVINSSSKDCYLRSEGRLIVAVGLENLIIVDTNDALLISNKNNSQEIKQIVEKLKSNGFKEGESHKKVYRPWGNFLSIAEDLRWQVKKIKVNPGSKLSLQMHHHRSEHWVVVTGTAKVEIDEKEFILCENQSAYIPVGSRHRLSNPGKIPLILIEVQSGPYLNEDDILRFEDNYGRNNLSK